MGAHFSKESRAILRTSMGDLVLEFLADKAPRTCEHFVKLAKRGFYDGLTFHRVLKDFMVQGGCPKGDGTGGPGFTVRAEFNDTPHVKGTVSLARGSDPHSGGSQFFICHGEARYLDSRYTAFARVVEGLEVLDRIAAVPVEESRYKERSVPRDPVFINSVTIEGVELEAEDGPLEDARGAAGRNAPSRRAAPPAGEADDDGEDDDADGQDDDEGDEPSAQASPEPPDADDDAGSEAGDGVEGGGAEPGAAGEGGEKRRRSRRGGRGRSSRRKQA